jgi:L-aspartate oxidase
LTSLASVRSERPALEAWEATNLITVATAIVASARLREESRGAHWRDDFEGRRPEWQGHLLAVRDRYGLRHEFVPAPDLVVAGR